MNKEEIGKILKDMRINAKMTQNEVAQIIGRSQQVIGHWETGYSQPDANTLFLLCDLYGKSVDESFGFKSNNANLSHAEQELLKKYRSLDESGKETINVILETQYKRCNPTIEDEKHPTD